MKRVSLSRSLVRGAAVLLLVAHCTSGSSSHGPPADAGTGAVGGIAAPTGAAGDNGSASRGTSGGGGSAGDGGAGGLGAAGLGGIAANGGAPSVGPAGVGGNAGRGGANVISSTGGTVGFGGYAGTLGSSGGNSFGGNGGLAINGMAGGSGMGGNGNQGHGGDLGTCGDASISTSAKAVPLDLYVLIDSSKSMNDPDAAGTAKWADLTKAMGGFFADANSAGFSVALKYFPDEQSGIPEVCSADSDCLSAGPCDLRKACVAKGTFSMSASTLCATASDCAANEDCAPLQGCPLGAGCMARSCAKSPSSAANCPVGCTIFTGYCRGRDVCDANAYATPALSFSELPASATSLVSSLNNHSPSGYTPTGPALAGALKASQQRAKDRPDHQAVVVVVTDGLPGAFVPGMPPATCVPADVPGISALLAGPAGAGGVPAIPTVVIGIFGPCDLQQGNQQMPRQNLDMWAAAAGTKNAIVIATDGDVAAQLQGALKAVQSQIGVCQYSIPSLTTSPVDYQKVNVVFTSDQLPEPTYVHYVASKDKCDSASGGWYYDVAPGAGTPKRIVACDKTCGLLTGLPGVAVTIAIGCATR